MKQKIAVLGPGSWGTALAQTLAENGHDVRIWGNVPEQIDEINTYHTNQHFLPDLTIPESIIGYKELAEAVDDADAGSGETVAIQYEQPAVEICGV